MLDAVHAGLDGVGDALGADRVGGDVAAPGGGGLHDGAQLSHGEPHVVGPIGGSGDAARGRDLDHLGAV
jgi:hypothetical protein